jgi:hypothetical protein
MYTKTIVTALILLLSATLLSGCASTYVVQVSAIAEPDVETTNTRYVLVNGNATGKENDLFFREFSAYFVPLLAEKGYQRVNSRDDADVEIFFRYDVSEGRTGMNTFSHPIYEIIGGNTYNIVETKTDGTGTTTTTRSTVHIPLQTLYVGNALESSSYTLYTSSAALEAYKIKPKGKVLWKTLMNITTESNDLRATMPIMAAAAGPFLAANSGAAKEVELKRDDPRIAKVRKSAGQ